MTTSKGLQLEEIKLALKELDQLSRDEYGSKIGLEDLLLNPSPEAALRVQRLVGIVLKRPFAKPGPPAPYSQTHALRTWPWKNETPEQDATNAPREFAILNELRMPGTWNEQKPLAGNADDLVPITWSQLKTDADTERGLFKILVLYVNDKLKNRETRTLQEYLKADESRRFEGGLDLATLIFDCAVTAPVATLLGIPSLAVGVVLVGIQYGYRRATDTTIDRVGDQLS